jgi:uncharacterized protein YdeI (YjbR/CyaY-like superfamily)
VADAIFFSAPEELRAWLEEHHETERELWVGYWKKATGKPTLTWSEAVDEALCFGWIDGKLQRIDDERHRQRFTPRDPRSNWSAVNVAKVAELRKQGRMRPAGEAAFAARSPEKTGVYTYENRHKARLSREQERDFRADPQAWEFFQAQPRGYRTTAIFWVVSAKREETRARRLATLIDCAREGRRVPALSP